VGRLKQPEKAVKVCAFHADRAAVVKGTRSTWDDPIKGGWFAKKGIESKNILGGESKHKYYSTIVLIHKRNWKNWCKNRNILRFLILAVFEEWPEGHKIVERMVFTLSNRVGECLALIAVNLEGKSGRQGQKPGEID
jgi:hypothetical protein